MKRKILIFFIIISIVCSSCLRIKYSLTLHQSCENIEKIELIDGDYDEYGPINTVTYVLDEDQIEAFVEDLTKIKCYKHFSPSISYANPSIWIYYQNGDIDIFSAYGNEYVSAEYDGLDGSNGWYYAIEEDINDLFTQYIG